MTAQNVAKHGGVELQPHFQACIVCQRAADSSAGNVNGNGNIDSKRGPKSQLQGPGPLLLCSTCPSAFHLSCLRPRLRVMPPPAAKWSCAYCFATGRAQGGDSDGACGAVRLMESMRQGMQGAVRVRMCCCCRRCCCRVLMHGVGRGRLGFWCDEEGRVGAGTGGGGNYTLCNVGAKTSTFFLLFVFSSEKLYQK